MRYDAAYTAFPLCAPGRACLMTGRHASEIGAWDNGALLAADQPTFAHYLSDAGYDTVLSGKMHFIGPDQRHGFRRRLTTDIYSSDFNWVRPEWIRLKETGGRDCEEVMSNRSMYNARGYTGDGVRIGVWHNALSYDEETHFRAVEYLRARKEAEDDAPLPALRVLPPPPLNRSGRPWTTGTGTKAPRSTCPPFPRTWTIIAP